MIAGNTFRVHSALENNLALIDLCNTQHGQVVSNTIAVNPGWHLLWNSTQNAVNFPAKVFVEANTSPQTGYELQLFNIDVCVGCQLGLTSKTLINTNAFSK